MGIDAQAPFIAITGTKPPDPQSQAFWEAVPDEGAPDADEALSRLRDLIDGKMSGPERNLALSMLDIVADSVGAFEEMCWGAGICPTCGGDSDA